MLTLKKVLTVSKQKNCQKLGSAWCRLFVSCLYFVKSTQPSGRVCLKQCFLVTIPNNDKLDQNKIPQIWQADNTLLVLMRPASMFYNLPISTRKLHKIVFFSTIKYAHYHLTLEEYICLLRKKHDFVKFSGVDMCELLNIEAGCVKTSRVLSSFQICGIFQESLSRSYVTAYLNQIW